MIGKVKKARKEKAAQLELFAGRAKGQVHALGLLGWEDPLWSTKIEIQTLGGTTWPITPFGIRMLHAVAKEDPERLPLANSP